MGMIERITQAEAARDLTGILERVRAHGVSFEIVRGDQVVARLGPPPAIAKVCAVEQFVEMWKRMPRLDPEDAAQFDADLIAIRKELPMQNRQWD